MLTEIPDNVLIQWGELEVSLCGANAPPVREGGAAQKAALFPQRAPLLAFAETLMIGGDASCWVCCESSAAAWAAADAHSAAGGKPWSALDPAKVGSVRRARAGGTESGALGRRTNEAPILPLLLQ